MHRILFVLALTAPGWANAAHDRPASVARISDLMTCAILLGLPADVSSLTQTTYGRARPTVFDEAGWPDTDDIAVSRVALLDWSLASSDVRVTHFGRRIEGRAKVEEFLRTVVIESARRGRQLADELPETFWTKRRVREILGGTGFAEELERRTLLAALASGGPWMLEARVWSLLHGKIPNIQFRAELLVRLALDQGLRTEWLNEDGRAQHDLHRGIESLTTPVSSPDSGSLSEGPWYLGVMTEDQLPRWVEPSTETVRNALHVLFWDVKLLTSRDLKIGVRDALPFQFRTFVRRDEAGEPVELILRGFAVHLPQRPD